MEETITRLSRELNLPPDVVLKAYKAYWLFIRRKIESLPLKEDIDEETLNKLRPNFNIPNLGKLTCTYERYIGVKKRNKIIKERNAKYKED